jgi:hypothetical protein
MSAPTSKAKLYYLPTAEPVATPPLPSRWTSLHRRLLRGWWRARLALAVRIGTWPRRHRDDEEYASFLGGAVADSPAEMIDRRRRRPRHPATVLDFQAARLRLRPQAT